MESNDSVAAAHKDLRKGVKAVAFISKLIGSKKKDGDGVADDESTSNDGRVEGNNAEVFAQPTDNIGFNPQYAQPPPYIKMSSRYKKEREFDRVFLAQELNVRKDAKKLRQNSASKLRRKSSAPADGHTVWAMEFSKDGKYLAAAGADSVVRVWQVIATSADRQKHEQQESEANGGEPHSHHLSAPVFIGRPIREYEGHTSTVLDLSWSKNNFLLSSSMDKTVRLWHVTRPQCLCTFKHNDFVPSIAFHPKDDRFFLAGSLDAKLRLWSIPEKGVAYAAQMQDMITAVAFTPDGKYAIAGCLGGACLFYEADGMKYHSQVQVRSSGQNGKSSKITGIQPHHDSRGDIKLLITSNDSRVRLYNLRDKNLEGKFRGNENKYSQIRAALTDDCKYVVCGSEDRKAYIWSMGPVEEDKPDKRPMELFEAHDSITTVVCFAPTKTRVLLGDSEDPVYDLCNPPPVAMLSREDRVNSATGSQGSSAPASAPGSIHATPSEAEGKFKKPKEPASYAQRATHTAGNIIVTADYTGSIKVFRQDCAWSKRKTEDDRASIFSKRTGRLSRQGSVMTKGSQPSLREGRMSASSAAHTDSILHWRQGIASMPNVADARQTASPKATPRSISPTRSEDQPLSQSPAATADWNGHAANKDAHTSDAAMAATATKDKTASPKARSPADNPLDIKHDESNPLLIKDGRSYLFWNTDAWRAQAEHQRKIREEAEAAAAEETLHPIAEHENHLSVLARPGIARGQTAVSVLSDERSSASEYEREEGKDGDKKGAETPAKVVTV